MLSALTLSTTAFAADSFFLTYKGENRWVAADDATDLRTLVKLARKQKATYFNAILPKNKRDTSIERLIVLRDILEKNLRSGIIIEEIDGETPDNSLEISITTAH